MKKILLILGFMLVIISGPIYSLDSIWVDREIMINPIFNKAFFYWGMNPQITLEELQNIIEQYPGTDYAANAQLLKIELYENCPSLRGEQQKALLEYQSMLQNYPNTKYWLIAKEEILFSQSSTFETWLPAENKLITDCGGESVYNIILGESTDFDVSQIAPQFRLVLAEFYTEIATSYEHRNNLWEAIRLYSFVETNFPKYTRIDVKESITDNVLKIRNINDYSVYSQDTPMPKMRIITPSEGSSIREDQSRIEFELKSGDIRGPRVELSELQFTLDGQDLTEKMKIKSTLDTSAKPGAPFETLNISYTPEQPLAPVTHTVYVKAVDNWGKVRQRTWTFIIQ